MLWKIFYCSLTGFMYCFIEASRGKNGIDHQHGVCTLLYKHIAKKIGFIILMVYEIIYVSFLGKKLN